MTRIIYPEELPVIRATGFSAQLNDPVIRTKMDAGPVKQRLRYTAVPKQFTGTVIVDEKERSLFEIWFTETLAFGTLRFLMQNPETNILEEFRFTKPYTEKATEGLFELSLSLERLP